MKIKIRNRKDFYAGLMFVFFGICFIVVSSHYKMGTLVVMGPGYFPYILGSILTVIGLISSIRAFGLGGEEIKPVEMRPLLLVLGSLLLFGKLIDSFGLFIAGLPLVFISCLASREFRIREAAIIYLVLMILCVVIFIYSLKLTIRMWPL